MFSLSLSKWFSRSLIQLYVLLLQFVQLLNQISQKMSISSMDKVGIGLSLLCLISQYEVMKQFILKIIK